MQKHPCELSAWDDTKVMTVTFGMRRCFCHRTSVTELFCLSCPKCFNSIAASGAFSEVPARQGALPADVEFSVRLGDNCNVTTTMQQKLTIGEVPEDPPQSH